MTENIETKPENTEVVLDDTPVLRCNRCNKPITSETAVLTPTGYRCQECVREQQKVFDTTKSIDPVIGFLISAIISFGGSWLVPKLGFFTLFIAPGVGTLIQNAVRLAVKKRRSKVLNTAVLAGAILGSLPFIIIEVLNLIRMPGDLLSIAANSLPLVWRAVYTALVSSTAYARFKGLRL